MQYSSFKWILNNFNENKLNFCDLIQFYQFKWCLSIMTTFHSTSLQCTKFNLVWVATIKSNKKKKSNYIQTEVIIRLKKQKKNVASYSKYFRKTIANLINRNICKLNSSLKGEWKFMYFYFTEKYINIMNRFGKYWENAYKLKDWKKVYRN